MLAAVLLTVSVPKLLVLDFRDPNFIVSIVSDNKPPVVVATITDDSHYAMVSERANLAVSADCQKFIIALPRYLAKGPTTEIFEYSIGGKLIDRWLLEIDSFSVSIDYFFGFDDRGFPMIVALDAAKPSIWDVADKKFLQVEGRSIPSSLRPYLVSKDRRFAGKEVIGVVGPRWFSMHDFNFPSEGRYQGVIDWRADWEAALSANDFFYKSKTTSKEDRPIKEPWGNPALLNYPWYLFSSRTNRVVSPGSSGGDREFDIYLGNALSGVTKRVCRGIRAIPLSMTVRKL